MSACANSENGPRLGTIAAAVHRARKNRVCLPKKVSAPLDLAWSAKKEIQRAPLERLIEPGDPHPAGLGVPLPPIQKEEPMNRFGILSLCATTGLGLALLSGTALGQQKSLKEQIVGSWTYVSADTVGPDGKRTSTFGPNPAGLTIFGSDGRYVSLVVRNDMPKFAANRFGRSGRASAARKARAGDRAARTADARSP